MDATTAFATYTRKLPRKRAVKSAHMFLLMLREVGGIRLYGGLLAACLALFCSTTAAAEETRELPDYAGREQKTSPGDVAIWVPRVALSPVYFVSEFVIRRPFGALISLAERKHVPEALYDFFTLTPDHKVGIVPTFFVDFGFKPSAGVYFFWDDFLASGNDLRIHAATWGPTWLAAGVTDRVRLNDAQALTLDVSGIRRPDYRYYGEGPSAPEGHLSRYGSDRLQAQLAFGSQFLEKNQLDVAGGVRRVTFHEPTGDYVPLLQRVEDGAFARPVGIDDGYTAAYTRAQVRLDTRKPQARAGSGVRFEAGAEEGTSLTGDSRAWVRWGGSATGYLDLNSRGRVLALTLTALFSDPLTDLPQPFTELVQLGGSGPMPGFLPGRLFGRSAAVATLSYHWPIWVWLNGTIQAAFGNVFDEHLEDFRLPLLRFSSAIGVETAGVTDNPVQILFGLGTETFESGAKLNAFRLVFGTSHEF
jgi:hypothetical protein